MKKIITYFWFILLPIFGITQNNLKTDDIVIKDLKKELDYLKQRNSDLKIQLQKIKKELTIFRELQMDNMDNINNTLLQVSLNSKSNKELIEVIKQEQEKNNGSLKSKIDSLAARFWILLLILLVALIGLACLTIILFLRNMKQVKLLSENTETRIAHVKEDLQLEVQKISKRMGERIDGLEKGIKDKK